MDDNTRDCGALWPAMNDDAVSEEMASTAAAVGWHDNDGACDVDEPLLEEEEGAADNVRWYGGCADADADAGRTMTGANTRRHNRMDERIGGRDGIYAWSIMRNMLKENANGRNWNSLW